MGREVVVPREKPTTDVLLNRYVINVASKSLFVLIDFMLFSGSVKEVFFPTRSRECIVSSKWVRAIRTNWLSWVLSPTQEEHLCHFLQGSEQRRWKEEGKSWKMVSSVAKHSLLEMTCLTSLLRDLGMLSRRKSLQCPREWGSFQQACTGGMESQSWCKIKVKTGSQGSTRLTGRPARHLDLNRRSLQGMIGKKWGICKALELLSAFEVSICL